MKGYGTSFAAMFTQGPTTGPVVERVEIPLIQRDYAQGRDEESVEAIRGTFVSALFAAIDDGPHLSLDFVYGSINGGTLAPLDGQQRLTTLFLLHWYLASRAGRLHEDAAWKNFSYATRASARLFCERLVQHSLPPTAGSPKTWIIDQPWYLFVWESDPSIRSMLVMLDAIETEARRRAPKFDPQMAWDRLTDPEAPAVQFFLLPLDDMQSEEDLYIKMNSRGKPLTPFETFKARFENVIRHSPLAKDLAERIDGPWSNLLWPFHGGDFIIDDELLHYLDFISEICEYRDESIGVEQGWALSPARTEALFGEDNPRAHEHLDFLMNAFEVWPCDTQLGTDRVGEYFDGYLSLALPGDESYDWRKVTLFDSPSANLFERCCRNFDSRQERNRAFSLQHSLLLYAFLVHLMHATADFAARLRVLRNLMAASPDLRRDRMPAFLSAVDDLILNGTLDLEGPFNKYQVADELLKRDLHASDESVVEALHRLEDNPILQGTLSCFDITPDTIQDRARSFEELFSDDENWLDLTAALLAVGDYQRQRPGSTAWHFGVSRAARAGRRPAASPRWRYLLTEGSREQLTSTREVLSRLLSERSSQETDTREFLGNVASVWMSERESTGRYDWRYYLVKYPFMREGESGIYYGSDGPLGYSMCMLNTSYVNHRYRDPILYTVARASETPDDLLDNWFSGYAHTPRWMRLVRSAVGMRSVPEGFALQPPTSLHLASTFDAVLAKRADIEDTGECSLLRIPQHEIDNEMVDLVDRVQIGSELLRRFVETGL